MGKDVLAKAARGDLADAFENGVAQIIEHHPTEARQRIGDNERNGDLNAVGDACGHSIDGALEGKGHDERRRFGEQDQNQGCHDPCPQPWFADGPQIRQEAFENGEIGARRRRAGLERRLGGRR